MQIVTEIKEKKSNCVFLIIYFLIFATQKTQGHIITSGDLHIVLVKHILVPDYIKT